MRAEAGDVVSGEAADNISVLDEAAQALERLAAHKRAREEFASHGVLQNVVALALAGNAGPRASRPGRYKFDAAVAFEALMDAPRETFQRVVTLAPDARGKHRARWLVGDVARLVVQTLEDGERGRRASRCSSARGSWRTTTPTARTRGPTGTTSSTRASPTTTTRRTDSAKATRSWCTPPSSGRGRAAAGAWARGATASTCGWTGAARSPTCRSSRRHR